MRASMARLTPRLSAYRAVREYTEHHYLPAATAYLERADDKGAIGADSAKWRRELEKKWAALGFGEVSGVTCGEQHVFEAEVHLGELEPEAVRVELYAEGVEGGAPVRQEMKRGRQLAGLPGGYVYAATVSAARAAKDYTARLVPHRGGVAIPLEEPRILWQR